MMDQEKDVLAAEYVLGTLGPDERAEAQALIAMDTRFAETVRSWERRLGELSAMVDPVEPPSDMWDRIKAGVAVSQGSAPDGASETADTPLVPSTPTSSAAEPVKAAEKPEPPAGETPPETGPVTPPETAAARPETVAGARPESAAGTPPQPPGATPRVLAVPPAEPAPQPRPEPSRDVLRFERPLRRWRTATVLTGSLAACLAALVAVQVTNPDLLPASLQPQARIVEVTKTVEVPSPKPAEFVAVLQKDASSPAFLLTFDLDKRQLTVRTVGAERQAGKSYELWLVSDKYPAPRSLGVIGTGAYTVRQPEPEYDPVVINRATYAVSLEPEGGSPTGAPTGPVLYTGKLLQATAPDFPGRTP
jgi:anti-sigma-K factor RskA